MGERDLIGILGRVQEDQGAEAKAARVNQIASEAAARVAEAAQNKATVVSQSPAVASNAFDKLTSVHDQILLQLKQQETMIGQLLDEADSLETLGKASHEGPVSK